MRDSTVYEINIDGKTYLGSNTPLEPPFKTQIMSTSLYDKAQFLKLDYIIELGDMGTPVERDRRELRSVFINHGE